MRFLFLCAFALLALASPAAAQDLFSSPFAAVTPERRGATSPAFMRYRYEAVTRVGEEAPVAREIVLEVGPDWSLVRDGARTTLHDFRMGRTFDISADGANYASFNALGRLAFLAAERRNRDVMAIFFRGLPNPEQAPDACDAESELGVAPDAQRSSEVAFQERNGAIVFTCNARAHGAFAAGAGNAPPAAFWPTLNTEMTTHPRLFRRVRDSGRAPQRIESRYRAVPGTETVRSWRLISAETSTAPYPLSAVNTNATAARLNVITVAGVGDLAASAVLGRAAGGPPTLASWDAHLARIVARDGRPAAAMLAMQTGNMFPELMQQCIAGAAFNTCTLMRDLDAIVASDPAMDAYIRVTAAEQSGSAADAVDAMVAAQGSAQARNPVLGASFALALMKMDNPALQRAEAAGLNTDIGMLQVAALQALPYNPAYWTDLGDYHGANYDWVTAYLLYDVGFSLPMPSAVRDGPAMQSKRQNALHLYQAYPDFFLPR